MSDDDTMQRPQRVLSIDVLRGLTIALMILVNDPGDSRHTYTQLEHAAWNGFTLTDFVFPNFLFLVGASIILSLTSRIARGDSKLVLARSILRRSFLIFVIKMALTIFPTFTYTHLRLFGVLTRIALCYLVVGLLCLFTQRARTLLLTAAVLLIGYWAMMRFAPVPGLGHPVRDFPFLDPDRNLAAWLDRAFNAFTQRWLHTGTLYGKTRDPEGILSTIPAVATTLLGAVAALWMRRVQPRDPTPSTTSVTEVRCFQGLLISGALSLVAGLAFNYWFPINKNLWTSSYVLFSAGLSLMTLALCYWCIDVQRLHETSRFGRWLTWPWLVFGANAITAFAISNVVVKLMIWIKFPREDGKVTNAWAWTYAHLFARGHSTENSSLAFALCFVLVCFVPNYFLYRKGIFLKV